MFDPAKEHRVKQIYRQVLDLYPSKENELAKALEDAQSTFETKVELIQSKANQQILEAKHKLELIESTMQHQTLLHKNELLELELKMIRMNNH